MELCTECIEWAKQENRTFLRQALEAKLISLYFDTQHYTEALALGTSRSRLFLITCLWIFFTHIFLFLLMFCELYSQRNLYTDSEFSYDPLWLLLLHGRVDRMNVCFCRDWDLNHASSPLGHCSMLYDFESEKYSHNFYDYLQDFLCQVGLPLGLHAIGFMRLIIESLDISMTFDNLCC